MKHEIPDTLLFRFFAGQASNEETDRIAAWLNENPEERQKHLNETHDLFLLSIMNEPELTPEADKNPLYRIRHARIFRQACGIAAALLLAFGISYLLFSQRLERMVRQTTSIEAPAGQHIRLALADGTLVRLNSKSRITYPALFNGRERRVRLEGEAMFDVKHDAEHPFIVETFACDVEVRGTQFNVLADEQTHEFSTALFQGCVAVRNKLIDEQILMEPNTVVDLRNGHLYLDELANRDDYLWTEGIVSFGGNSFEQIVAKLEKYYGVEVVVERRETPVIRYKHLKVRTAEGVDHALRVLQRASDFTFEYDNASNRIFIR